jgi:formylglycine-generating enzyme required for sulfatase activity
LLSLEPYFARDLPPRTEQALLTFLEYVLRNNQCQSERSAAEWLLRRLKHEETIRTVNRDVAAARFSATALRDHEWWVTTDGHTMLVIRRPGEVPISSFEDKSNGDEATMTRQTLPYDFAISVHEVTMEQFRRFRPDANFALDVADDPQCPANKVSFNDAIKYCEWLNDQEGISAEERCYDPDAAIDNALAALPTQKLMRSGYRLPTEVEWEFACRAKSTTTWVCGADSEHLSSFAWFNVNSDRQLHQVGLLRPNPLGLFDVAGNVSEWCHTSADDQKLILRGGMYDEAARLLRSGRRQSQSSTGYSFTGFRIARTLPAKN